MLILEMMFPEQYEVVPPPKRRTVKRKSENTDGRAAKTIAKGFVISKTGKGLIAAGTEAIKSPAGIWMHKFLGACAWAFMIAAGSLVYSHFTQKWKDSGYPMLPVAAFAAAEQIKPTDRSIPLERSSYGRREEREEPTQTSFLEEYDG